MAYADLTDYEVVTGQTVPEAEVPRIQRALQSASNLFALYLGDREAEIVAVDAYAALLNDLTVARVVRVRAVPQGIRSESVGGSSVTYDAAMATSPFVLSPDETRLLAMLLAGGRVNALRSVVMSSQGIVASGAVEEE